MTEVRRSANCGSSPQTARAEAIVLMGAGARDPDSLAEAARRDRSDGALSGRSAIGAAAVARRADPIRVEPVVTDGRAGPASGNMTRGTDVFRSARVVRCTATATPSGLPVSFDHPGGA